MLRFRRSQGVNGLVRGRAAADTAGLAAQPVAGHRLAGGDRAALSGPRPAQPGEHALPVAQALWRHDLPEARRRVAFIVSRDTSQLDEEGVARAATESVLENGSDAVFAALFWFIVAGAPGVVLYRLSNTLDAMWAIATRASSALAGRGAHRRSAQLRAGTAGRPDLCLARPDPSRAALLAYPGALVGQPQCRPGDGRGAGALGVVLGGAAIYHGELHARPELGRGSARRRGISNMRWIWSGPVSASGCWCCCSEAGSMLEHGGRLRLAAQRHGIPLSDWLDLSTGVAPYHPDLPTITSDARARLPEPDDGLDAAAQQYYGARAVLPVAGSQSAIRALPRLRGPARVGIVSPCYAEHAKAWRRAGHRVVELCEASVPRALDQLDVLLVVNPNNPTGQLIAAQRLLQWRSALATYGGWLVVDEAFMDCTPEHSLAAHSHLPGLVVLRSFGKFFGLAGARLGFVLAHAGVLRALAELLGPGR